MIRRKIEPSAGRREERVLILMRCRHDGPRLSTRYRLCQQVEVAGPLGLKNYPLTVRTDRHRPGDIRFIGQSVRGCGGQMEEVELAVLVREVDKASTIGHPCEEPRPFNQLARVSSILRHQPNAGGAERLFDRAAAKGDGSAIRRPSRMGVRKIRSGRQLHLGTAAVHAPEMGDGPLTSLEDNRITIGRKTLEISHSAAASDRLWRSLLAPSFGIEGEGLSVKRDLDRREGDLMSNAGDSGVRVAAAADRQRFGVTGHSSLVG